MVQLMSFRTLRPARCRLTCSRRTSRYRVAERLIRGIGSQLPCSDGLFFARSRRARGPTGGAMRLRLLAPHYWLTWAGLGLLRLVALLPFPWIVALGGLLGKLLRRLPIGFVRTARRNLELCFPELSPAARQRLLDAHFVSIGIHLLDSPLAWWSPPARIARMVRVEGAEHLRAAVARGQGVILLTAHFTPLGMAGRALASVGPVRFLYGPTRNAVLCYALRRFRCAHGGQGI